jgi:hypothetical protein
VRLYRLLVTDSYAALGLALLVFGAGLLAGVFLTWPT